MRRLRSIYFGVRGGTREQAEGHAIFSLLDGSYPRGATSPRGHGRHGAVGSVKCGGSRGERKRDERESRPIKLIALVNHPADSAREGRLRARALYNNRKNNGGGGTGFAACELACKWIARERQRER